MSAFQRTQLFCVIDGGNNLSSGRHLAPDEPVARVLPNRRARRFGTAELELMPATHAVASHLVISFPFANAFGNEAMLPQTATDGAPWVFVRIGDRRVFVHEVRICQNWLRLSVSTEHPGKGTDMSQLLRESASVFVYWVGLSGEEIAVTLQIQGAGCEG